MTLGASGRMRRLLGGQIVCFKTMWLMPKVAPQAGPPATYLPGSSSRVEPQKPETHLLFLAMAIHLTNGIFILTFLHNLLRHFDNIHTRTSPVPLMSIPLMSISFMTRTLSHQPSSKSKGFLASYNHTGLLTQNLSTWPLCIAPLDCPSYHCAAPRKHPSIHNSRRGSECQCWYTAPCLHARESCLRDSPKRRPQGEREELEPSYCF